MRVSHQIHGLVYLQVPIIISCAPLPLSTRLSLESTGLHRTTTHAAFESPIEDAAAAFEYRFVTRDGRKFFAVTMGLLLNISRGQATLSNQFL